MTDKFNSINSKSEKHPSKYHQFVENTKDAVRKTLTTAGIAVSSILPTSVNTISTISPLASTTATTITLGTATSLMTACGGEEPDDPIEIKDTTPPTINVSQSEIDITGGKEIRISGNQLYIGDILVASWSDNKSKNCNVSISINGKSITSGTTINEGGTLEIKITDEAGNLKNASIKLNITKNAPSITVNQYEVNIFGGTTVNVKDNQLLFGDEVIASRNDEDLEGCKVSLKFNGKDIKSGDTINEEGKLTITVTNKNSITSNVEITLKNEALYGLDNLKNASIQADQEINLLDGITLADGVELVKTEVEMDGKRSAIDPSHYTPEYPGTMNIIFTVKGKNGNLTEIKVDNLTIKPLEYEAIELNNIKPVDILPIIGQVEAGDKNVYEHIEHLRIAEATRIRDMMWKYGTSNHSPEEYQELMMRLNTGMMGENPLGYDNYEAVGGTPMREPTNHAHAERFTLTTLINHANFKVLNHGYESEELYNLCKSNPNQINIIGCSVDSDVNKEQYNMRNNKKLKQYDKEKNRLIICAGGNIRTKDGNLHNKVYQEDLPLPDEHSVYSSVSRAHNKDDNTLDRHLLITFGTDEDGDIDQTNEEAESSKFPVGFHNKVIFSGRTFPFRTDSNSKIEAFTGKYATSHSNYVNVAIADLCFQMKADIADVDELLEMIRSTSLTDYIRFDLNGDGDTNDNYEGQPESQPLQLMNPAGFFKKYLMPNDLPTNIKSGETKLLNKGYYKGIIFDIPGAEIKINGQWIAYNNTNKSLIKNQNPMNLKRRLNGDLCRKLGYTGKNIPGKIIVVDDERNGLNIDKDFSITLE